MSRNDDPPPILSYRTGKDGPPRTPPRAEMLLLIVAAVAICLPPVSMGLSVLAILRGLQVSKSGPHADVSSGWILILGGIVMLLVSTGITVMFAREMW